MELTQIRLASGERRVAVTGDGPARLLPGVATIYMLARTAIMLNSRLDALVEARLAGAPEEPVDLARAYAEGRVLAPIDHPDPAHLIVTGTGLTHLGSAESRDKMHKDMTDPAKQTDSMKMFKKGVDGGKPKTGEVGTQPEWFYKGDGSVVVSRRVRHSLRRTMPWTAATRARSPASCRRAGWHAFPRRLRAQGNEFFDHVMERENYLYLAHSKLRACSFGPIAARPAGRSRRGPCRGGARRQADLGEAVPVGRGEHVPYDRQSRRPITSNIRCSAGRATSMSIISEPQR